MRCAEYYGHPPLVAEFDWWREREFELARARGEEHELHLPSRMPYRRRYGGWEEALLHFGFTPDEIDRRFEFTDADADRNLPEGLPIAELRDPIGKLSLATEQAERMVAAYRAMPKRSRYVLTARLGLGMEPAYLKAVAKPLALHLSRVAQLQTIALEALCHAAAGDGRGRPTPSGLLDEVEATLRRSSSELRADLLDPSHGAERGELDSQRPRRAPLALSAPTAMPSALMADSTTNRCTRGAERSVICWWGAARR